MSSSDSGNVIDKSSGKLRMLLFVAVVLGFLVRCLHNTAIMASPTYVVPLGHQRIFLEWARMIVAGDLLPGDRPFTESSPYLPYLYAFLMRLFGENFLVFRLVGILADTFSIWAIGRLGARAFGGNVGVIAAFFYAVLGPAVYFSCELIYIPFAIAALTASMLALVSTPARPILGGLLLALLIGFMPTAVIFGPLFALALVTAQRARSIRQAFVFAVATGIGILPLTIANYVNSGQFVGITVTGGHNFFLGHNRTAEPAYFMPSSIAGVPINLRGSTFDELKTVAEHVEKRTMLDSEISGFFFKLGLQEIAMNPSHEFLLLLDRVVMFLQKGEVLTYGSYSYTEFYSKLLRWLPRIDVLFAFAALGLLRLRWNRESGIVVAPIAGALLSVVLFFFLTRFRMPALPSLCVLAACGVELLLHTIRTQAWTRLVPMVIVPIVVFVGSGWGYRPEPNANEWSKAGAIYMKLGELEKANEAFLQANADDPLNPNPIFNMSLLYERQGRHVEAAQMKREAQRLRAARSVALPDVNSAQP